MGPRPSQDLRSPSPIMAPGFAHFKYKKCCLMLCIGNLVMLSLIQQNFKELLDDATSEHFGMNDGAKKFEEKVVTRLPDILV